MVTQPSGTVTFAFCDVEGSTRLWHEHPDEMAAMLARHDVIVRELVDTHDGYVFATGGDSFGVAFSGVSSAVSWAQELHDRLADERWSAASQFKVRIGMHTGEAEERGGDYFGPAVNLAARIGAVGHGGQTLLSDATAALANAPSTELGRFRLKDMPAPQRIFQAGNGAFPSLRTDGDRRGNLPRRAGRLIGREAELAELAGAVVDGGLLTLVGPGGIGKTRLAIELARREARARDDGAWLVELASIAEGADAPRALADVLGVKESEGRTVTETVVAELARRHGLVLLDNCEHVVDGVRTLVEELLEGCPQLSVLATSREGLGTSGERLVAVGPLPVSTASVELFAERATAVDARFDIDEHRPAVLEVCARLDGVPLAIELAAARVRSLTPAQLAARLDDHFRVLTAGRRSAVERHRTLRAAVEWSYQLLDDDERETFDRLSVFVGWFDLEAVEAVCADGPVDDLELIDVIDRLIDRSMLTASSGPFGRRFRVLETLRQYGAERLALSGHGEPVARRHAHHYRDLAVELGDQLCSHDEVEAVARADQAWDNLRAAVAWACAEGAIDVGLGITSSMHFETLFRGRVELGDWNEQLMAATSPDDPRFHALAAFAAHRYFWTNDREGFEHFARTMGSSDHPLWAIVEATFAEDYEAVARLQPVWEAHLVATEDRSPRHGGVPLNAVSALARLGRLDEARTACETVAERARRDGPPSLERVAWELLGLLGLVTGDADLLRRAIERTVRIVVPERTFSVAPVFDTFALVDQGDVLGAARHLGSGLRDDLETGQLLTLDAKAALFINVAGRLGLGEPLERVRQLYAARPSGRLYEWLMGEELPPAPDTPLDDDLAGPELAAFMADALDVALADHDPA